MMAPHLTSYKKFSEGHYVGISSPSIALSSHLFTNHAVILFSTFLVFIKSFPYPYTLEMLLILLKGYIYSIIFPHIIKKYYIFTKYLDYFYIKKFKYNNTLSFLNY